MFARKSVIKTGKYYARFTILILVDFYQNQSRNIDYFTQYSSNSNFQLIQLCHNRFPSLGLSWGVCLDSIWFVYDVVRPCLWPFSTLNISETTGDRGLVTFGSL